LCGPTGELLSSVCRGRTTVIVHDEALPDEMMASMPRAARISVRGGESCKTLATAESIYRRLAACELDRTALLVGVGGGTITDLAGFVAATYLRGISVGLVPTTLLAQVDAAIGGKNGVNLDGFKNLVGTISQPSFVLLDPAWLSGLPPTQIQAGLAEVVKAGAVADRSIIDRVEASVAAVLALEGETLLPIIQDAVAVKQRLVAVDERDIGARRLLNFGHTLGHALERASGMPHGQAVAVGMAWAGRISVRLGLLPEPDLERLVALLSRLGLHTGASCSSSEVIRAVRRDKKRRGEMLDLVLLERLGQGVVQPTPLADIEEACRDLR